ncbi:AI-2E family transporter [Changchengzhania lutea]|uniref:AI-2E family transporter n=1 Tax=Changchengzhania lutea TaxID=2049305 RepID=UPI00115C5F17|nr:AI-2E family transporter [Changchengzhania lutea]
MKSNKITRSHLQTIAIVLGFILLIYFLYKIQSLIIYIFVASVISLLCRPIVAFFNNKLKLSNTLSAFLTLVFVIGFFSFVIWIFFPIIINQGQQISEIDFDMVKQDLNELNIQASEFLGVEQINIIEYIKNTEFARNFNSELVLEFIGVFFDNIGGMVAGIFSILFISYFLLKDDRLIGKAVSVFAEDGKERRFYLVLQKSKILLSRYFMGLFLQTLIIAVLYFFLLLYIDIENTLAIALICAFLNIVPYLGPLIGLVVMILVVISNNLSADFSSELFPLLLVVLAGVAIVQLIDNLISQPVIFGKSVKSHPLEIFVVIVIGGLLVGILGMILAVPVYTTIKVIAKEFLSEYKIVKHLTKDI